MTTTFQLLATAGAARCGTLTTAHGTVQTPAFMATATIGSVKGIHWRDVQATGAELVICNTYHFMLRPGATRMAAMGGLHRLLGWQGPILTDSGGYQVMSLKGLTQLTETGVIFKSHLDGSRHELTPARSTQIQHALDSNISMVLDECTPYPASLEVAAVSMRRSMRWAAASREAFVARAGYGQFGIVQGGIYPQLRLESAAALQQIGFEGYAMGGLAVGEPQATMFQVLDETLPALPTALPRYLMGVGKPDDILGAVLRGIDLFDCVMPTRSGRTGQAFTPYGPINIRNARHADDLRPLQADSDCPASLTSRAYLHHLFKANEMLGPMLLSWHNLHYYQSLLATLRTAIAAGSLADTAATIRANWARGDLPPL